MCSRSLDLAFEHGRLKLTDVLASGEGRLGSRLRTTPGNRAVWVHPNSAHRPARRVGISMLTNRERLRHLQWDGCYNARDLGGYRTVDGGETRWGAVVRADNLSRLSEEGRAALVEYGAGAIIDLRCPWELNLDPPVFTAEPPAEGEISYLNLPMIDESDVDATTVFERATSKEEMYTLMLDVYQAPVAAILNAIAEAPEMSPVLIHCHSGKDRTGLISALLLSVAGVPAEAIAGDYALTDTCLQPLHDRLIDENGGSVEERAAMAYELSSPPEVMQAVFQHLEQRYGGTEGYVLQAGLRPENLDRLRERLRG